jgi:hypothetical protein
MRASGLGIVANVATMAFAGFAPFFVTWLIEATGSSIAPVFYVMFGAAISLVATFFLVDRAHEARLPIRDALGQFLLRGLDCVRGEWSLVTMAWNIKRMRALSLG